MDSSGQVKRTKAGAADSYSGSWLLMFSPTRSKPARAFLFYLSRTSPAWICRGVRPPAARLGDPRVRRRACSSDDCCRIMDIMSKRAFYILLEAAVVLGVVLGTAARVLFNRAMKQNPRQVVPRIRTISRIPPMSRPPLKLSADPNRTPK